MTYYGQFSGQVLSNVTDTTSYDASTSTTTMVPTSTIRFDSAKDWDQLTKADLISGGACTQCIPEGEITFA